jgi:hypothetical protein
MRISGLNLAAAAAVLALGAAQPAWAVQSKAEITGTATVVDTSGFTGPPNTTYQTTFDLTFFVNDAPAPGVEIDSVTNEAPFTKIFGVLSRGAAAQIQADLSFGYGGDLGFGFDFGGPGSDAFGESARGLLDPTAGLGPGGVLDYAADTTINDPDTNFFFNLNFEMLSPTNFGLGSSVDYNKPFTYAFGPDDQVLDAEGVYRISCDNQSCLQTNVSFTLNPETITVTSNEPLAGVPEPAAWGLMIMGFGVVGAAVRRRRGQVNGQALAA